eukprot:gene1903-2717_t
MCASSNAIFAEVTTLAPRSGLRDKVADKMAAALRTVKARAGSLLLPDLIDGEQAREIGFEIEAEMANALGSGTKEYTAKGRSLIFNIGKNQVLRERLLDRSFPVVELVGADVKDLAPDALKAAREASSKRYQAQRKLAGDEVVVGWAQGTTGKLEYSHKYDEKETKELKEKALHDAPVGPRRPGRGLSCGYDCDEGDGGQSDRDGEGARRGGEQHDEQAQYEGGVGGAAAAFGGYSPGGGRWEDSGSEDGYDPMRPELSPPPRATAAAGGAGGTVGAFAGAGLGVGGAYSPPPPGTTVSPMMSEDDDEYDPFTFDSAVHKKASAAALGMPHSIEGSGASKGAVAKPAFIDPAAAAQGATRGTKRSPPSPSAAQTAQKKGKPALHSSTEACPAPSTAPEFAVAPVRATSVAAAVRGLPPAGETGAEVALEKLRGLANVSGDAFEHSKSRERTAHRMTARPLGRHRHHREAPPMAARAVGTLTRERPELLNRKLKRPA